MKIAEAQQAIQDAAKSIQSSILARREDIEELEAERDELESGYLPLGDVTQRIAAMINHEAGKFDAEYLLGNQIRNARRFLDSSLLIANVDTLVQFEHKVNLGPLLAFLFGDEIKQRLAAYVETLDLPTGPTAEERPALIKKLDQEILQLEIEEERLICEAESAGIQIARHPDAEPAVVLEWKD